ncbi:Condensin-2 complex subunit D3 [Entomophthora muscae]|uniref:Condensin-2 complex subunit D3 n=1 Tax=Entomophthora muscae TaxID=34485 RepID=A0ACC2RTT8_9FUNG|nr:Condensin-2 complex subunit D3 [Entomophthora muscae]
MAASNSLYQQLLEKLLSSGSYAKALSQLNNGNLPIDCLLDMEQSLEELLTRSSLPLNHISLRVGFIGMPAPTLHGSSSVDEGTGQQGLPESSFEADSTCLEELDNGDLEQLIKILGILSTVRYSSNPKRINLFTAGSTINYRHLHQFLFDLLYTLCHDTAPPSPDSLLTLCRIILAYLFMVATPGSKEHDLVSAYAINWILSLLKDSLGALTPESQPAIDCIQMCLVLLVKVILDHSVLHALGPDLINFLGLLSAADPLGPDFPLATSAYECIALVLESSYFALRDIYPHVLKWLCFSMRKPPQSQLAILFLCRSLDYLIPNGCIDLLMCFFKNVTTEFVDKAPIRASIATNLAKILASLDYSEAQHILENLLKDCIQAALAPTRALTVEIFEAWINALFYSRPDHVLSKVSSYTPQELQDLSVALLDLIAGRLLDQTLMVRSRALTAYLTAVKRIQRRARRPNPPNDIATRLMQRLESSSDERFANVLARCSGDLNFHVRQLAIQLFSFFLNLHLVSDPSAYESFLGSTLAAYIQQCQDPNWRVRKSCISCMAQSLSTAFDLANAGSVPRVFGALWDLWVEYSLPTMFDPEKEVVEVTLWATVEFLQRLSGNAIFSVALARPFPELSLKGLRQIFFLLAERDAVQRNINTEPEKLPAQTSLLKCSQFINFIFSEGNGCPGHWQLAAAISSHAQLSTEVMEAILPHLVQIWLQAKDNHTVSDWILVGSSILNIFYNWGDLSLPHSFLFEIGDYLLKLEAPLQWISPMLRLLQRLGMPKWPTLPNKKVESFEDFAGALMTFCCKVCQRIADELDKDDVSTLEGSFLTAVSTAAFTVGDLCLVSPTTPVDEAFKVLLTLIGQVRRNCTSSFLFPDTVRALAFISIGKLGLIHEHFAKQLIPAVASELDLQPLVAQRAQKISVHEVFSLESQAVALVQHSALVVFADLCLRYTSATDNYLALIANCLRHPHAAMRQKSFLMFTRLLRNDFIKWRGHLAFKFIVSLVTECDDFVREFAYYCFIHVLLVKTPSLLLDKLIGLILFINGHHPPKNALHLPPTEEESLLFTFPGGHEVRRRFRHRCYKFVLEHLTAEQRFRATDIICRQLLAPAAEGAIDIRTPLGKNVLEDALHILGSKEIQISVPMAKPDDTELDSQSQQRIKLLSSINLHHAVVNIIPTVLHLKSTLERHRSPLQGTLMECFGRIVVNYRIDTDSLLATVDAKHIEELRYDLTRLHQDVANKKQRTESRLTLNQSNTGLLPGSRVKSKTPTPSMSPPTEHFPTLITPSPPVCHTPLQAKTPPIDPSAIITSTPPVF